MSGTRERGGRVTSESSNIAHWLFQAAERWPERGLTTLGVGRMTFPQLLSAAESVAGGLVVVKTL